MKAAEYMRVVEEYLGAVRRLETALCRHLVVVTAEMARARGEARGTDEQERGNPL